MASKNLCNKMRKADNPYETWVYHPWTWHVLRKYQSPEQEAKNPHARWFCFVTSAWCPEGEYGDVYVNEIVGQAKKMI